MRPFAQINIDSSKLISNQQTYIRELVYELFVQLHTMYDLELDSSKGYVVERRTVGFDHQLKLTVFETRFKAQLRLSEGQPLWAPVDRSRLLDEDVVQEYITRYRDEGRGHQVKEESVRRSETETSNSE